MHVSLFAINRVRRQGPKAKSKYYSLAFRKKTRNRHNQASNAPSLETGVAFQVVILAKRSNAAATIPSECTQAWGWPAWSLTCQKSYVRRFPNDSAGEEAKKLRGTRKGSTLARCSSSCLLRVPSLWCHPGRYGNPARTCTYLIALAHSRSFIIRQDGN
jgi:hypothetical protein